MKREFTLAETNGKILIENRFETEKGNYRVVVSRYRAQIYFFKYRDGKLLECQNLTMAKPKEV